MATFIGNGNVLFYYKFLRYSVLPFFGYLDLYIFP